MAGRPPSVSTQRAAAADRSAVHPFTERNRTLKNSRGTAIRVLLGAIAAAAVTGALGSAALASPPLNGGAVGPTMHPETIATVSGAGVTVSFLALPGRDGQPLIALQEQGSARSAGSPVPALITQRLTSQEIYLALAPAGATAPAELSRLQTAEAAQLGRDAAVRTVRATAPAITPQTVQSCGAGLAPWNTHGAWVTGGASYPSGTSGTQSQYVGGSSGFETTSPVAFAACNTSSTANLTVSYAINQRWNNLGWQASGTAVAGPGGFFAWYFLSRHTDSDGVLRGASYVIKGLSTGSFDLVTARWASL
jgi:hypothetical protein